MKFNISKLENEYKNLINTLFKKYIDENSKIFLKYIKTNDKKVEVTKIGEDLIIKASSKTNFLKGLSEYIIIQKNLIIENKFEKLGIMIDNSRNGVMNVKYTKNMIELISKMGFNTMYLYLEDIYLLEKHPYFGYLRGAYSKEELKEIDDYANSFGIEIVPCIQTLAHLNQYFYWEHIEQKYADIADILFVGKKEVNELIDDMIKFFKETFRSNRIHLGMDEAYSLGRGNYATKNGLKEKTVIMLEHIENVLSICNKYEMKAIIWDDMFYSNYSRIINNEIKIPNNLYLMYWNYYNTNEDYYIEEIQKRKQITQNILFAGGSWRWTGYTPHHKKTITTLKASIRATKKEKIEEFLLTSWADDGAESPVFNAYFGAMIASIESFNENSEIDNIDYLNKVSQFYFGETYDNLYLVGELDNLDKEDLDITPSKYFFYEDLFISKFVYHNMKINRDLSLYYENLERKFNKISNGYENTNFLKKYFEFYSIYSNILKNKWNLAVNIYFNYNKKNKLKLLENIEKIDEILEKLLEFKKIRKEIWYFENKRYGFEVLDQRIGGIYSRLVTVKEDLILFIDGKIEKIEELEEKRISVNQEEKIYLHYNRAERIANTSRMDW